MLYKENGYIGVKFSEFVIEIIINYVLTCSAFCECCTKYDCPLHFFSSVDTYSDIVRILSFTEVVFTLQQTEVNLCTCACTHEELTLNIVS